MKKLKSIAIALNRHLRATETTEGTGLQLSDLSAATYETEDQPPC